MTSAAGGNEPHVGEGPAAFINEGQDVYALIGVVLDRDKVAADHPVDVLVAPGTFRQLDAEFLPVFEFFQTPRTESQAREWLDHPAEHSGPATSGAPPRAGIGAYERRVDPECHHHHG